MHQLVIKKGSNVHLFNNFIHAVVKKKPLTAQSDYGIHGRVVVGRFPTETKFPETKFSSHDASCSVLSGALDFHLVQNLGMSEAMLLILAHMLL